MSLDASGITADEIGLSHGKGREDFCLHEVVEVAVLDLRRRMIVHHERVLQTVSAKANAAQFAPSLHLVNLRAA